MRSHRSKLAAFVASAFAALALTASGASVASANPAGQSTCPGGNGANPQFSITLANGSLSSRDNDTDGFVCVKVQKGGSLKVHDN